MIITVSGPDDRRKLNIAEDIANKLDERKIPVSIALEPRGLVDIEKGIKLGMFSKERSKENDEMMESLNFIRAYEAIEAKTPGNEAVLMISSRDLEKFVVMFDVYRLKEYLSFDGSFTEDQISADVCGRIGERRRV